MYGGSVLLWGTLIIVKSGGGLWVLLVVTHGHGVPGPICTSPITYSRVPIAKITPCLFLDPRCLLISKVSPTRYPSKSQLGV